MAATGDPVRAKGDQTLWCVGIALDIDKGMVYWTQKGGDNAGQGVIRRATMEVPKGESPYARHDIQTLFAHLPEPIDLDLDLKTRTMYWSDRGDNTISRAPMDPPAASCVIPLPFPCRMPKTPLPVGLAFGSQDHGRT